MNRIRLTLAFLLIASIVSLTSLHSAAQYTGNFSAQGESSSSALRREGTHVDIEGHFSISGERATFQAGDDSVQFRALENLALDRVLRMVRDAGSRKLHWNIEGSLTEFHGQNFLLVEHAVVISRDTDNSPTP